MTVTLPKIAAHYISQLSQDILAADTTIYALNPNDEAGNPLNGLFSFTIDVGTTAIETIVGTISGGTITGCIRGVDPQNPANTDASLAKNHSQGASIKITDYISLTAINNKLNGAANTPANDAIIPILRYDATQTFTDPLQIPDKAYVDAATGTPGQVKVDIADTTPDYLNAKLNVAGNLQKTIQNIGGDENILITALGGGAGTKFAVDTTDVSVPQNTTTVAYTVHVPANTLGTDDALRFTLVGFASTAVSVSAHYGGQLIGTFTLPSAGGNHVDIRGLIMANSATNSQKSMLMASYYDGTVAQNEVDYRTTTVDDTANQDLTFTITTGTGQTASVHGIIVEQITSGTATTEFTYGETIADNDYVFQSDGGETILVTNNNIGNFYRIASVGPGGTWVADRVTISDPRIIAIRSVKLNVNFRATFGAGYLLAQIYAVSGGLPTGSPLATSNHYLTANFDAGLNEFTFPTPFIPVTGTTYAIVLNTLNATGVNSFAPIGIETSAGGNPTMISTDGGITWSAPAGGGLYSQSVGNMAIGKVFRVDIVTPILDMGPYKGFATASGTVGDVHEVELIEQDGFSALVEGLNVYINPAVIGGITQSPTGAGRAIGTAISAGQIQLMNMRKRGAAIPYSGSVLNQDGFLIVTTTGLGVIVGINEQNALGTVVQISQVGFIGGGSGADCNPSVTVPVRAGYSYSLSAGAGSYLITFYPTING